jgi:hypothetical protein
MSLFLNEILGTVYSSTLEIKDKKGRCGTATAELAAIGLPAFRYSIRL